MEKVLAIIGKILRSTLGLYAVAWALMFSFALTVELTDNEIKSEEIMANLFVSTIMAFPFTILIAIFTIPFFNLKDELELRKINKELKKLEEERDELLREE